MILKTTNSRPHNWLIHHYTASAVKRNAHYMAGVVIDVGCGTKPYEKFLMPYCKNYIGIDYLNTLHGFDKIDVFGSGLALPFANNSIDSVVSFQVMEHIPEPETFLRELYRVVKKGGHILIATPFLWGEHEEPYDYYRYTRYGLRYLSEKTGFEVVAIEPDTGVWSSICLQFNYSLYRVVKLVPILHLLFQPVWLNQFIALLLDKVDARYRKHTATFMTVLRKL